MQNIIVVPYDSNWPEKFATEKVRITDVFAPFLVDLHHIGSTAVPGLSAKPVIDMLLLVKDIREVDGKNDEMRRLGYEAKGEFGIAGRRFFTKGRDDSRTHHLHTFESGNLAVENHLKFRDYLIAHPEDSASYGKIKNELSVKYRNDIEGYMAGKDPLIKEFLAKAEKWRHEKSRP